MHRSKTKYLLFDKHFLVITLLALGLVAGVSVINQQTQTQQHASEAVNLNSASEIDSTINADRTMGPQTSQGNFSKTLPSAYLGKAVVSVEGSKSSAKISSLTLIISKAEVHLVHLFMPGVSSSSSSEGISGLRTNQDVSKWETLQLNGNNDNNVILRLDNGLVDTFGSTQLAGGKYSEIRLYIAKATAKLTNGKETELVLPGSTNIIRVVNTFNLFSNKTTYLTLEVNFKDSILQDGDIYFFKPVISRITVSN